LTLAPTLRPPPPAPWPHTHPRPQDTDADGAVPAAQQVVLAYRGDGTVATADDPPVALGRMPPEWVAAMGPKLLRPGRLLRFGLGPGGLRFEGGSPAGADLKYGGPANQRRGRADIYSKVLFQALARAGAAPGLDELRAAAAAGGGGGGAGGAGAPDAAMAGG
jgi:snurportin-1